MVSQKEFLASLTPNKSPVCTIQERLLDQLEIYWDNYHKIPLEIPVELAMKNKELFEADMEKTFEIWRKMKAVGDLI